MKKILTLIRRNFISLYLKVKSAVGSDTTTFRLTSGEKFKIRNIDKLGKDLINGEAFEDRTKDLLMKTVKEGMIVLDIGANIGYYTVKMSTIVGQNGKVLAFEPNPAIIQQLQENLNINNITNTEVIPIALSDQAGSLPFFNPSKGNEAHGSLKENNTFNADVIIHVKTERLDDVLKKAGINRVDFIKIDVEGAEYEVLSGASKLLTSGSRPIIIFESAENLVNAFGHKVYDVLKLVADFGYEIENIDWGNWIAKPNNDFQNNK